MPLYQEVKNKHWNIFLYSDNAQRDRWHLPYPGAVVLGTLVAFPAATIDPSDKGQEELLLIDLQGLVFHHAPSASTLRRSDSIPRTARNPGKRSAVKVGTDAVETEACRITLLRHICHKAQWTCLQGRHHWKDCGRSWVMSEDRRRATTCWSERTGQQQVYTWVFRQKEQHSGGKTLVDNKNTSFVV